MLRSYRRSKDAEESQGRDDYNITEKDWNTQSQEEWEQFKQDQGIGEDGYPIDSCDEAISSEAGEENERQREQETGVPKEQLMGYAEKIKDSMKFKKRLTGNALVALIILLVAVACRLGSLIYLQSNDPTFISKQAEIEERYGDDK